MSGMRVVLLVADGLQAAAIGPYGNDWIDTPHLNEFANKAVVFDSHFADLPVTSDPSTIRRLRHAFGGLSTDAGDWFEFVRDAKVVTNWIKADIQSQAASSQYQNEAIDRFLKCENGVTGIECVGLTPPWSISEEILTASFQDWDLNDEPEPMVDPQPGLIDVDDDIARESLQRTYAAAVLQFDQWIGDLMSRLSNDDLVILTAGVGQNLGEHGLVGEELPWLHEELVHLPLIVRLPKLQQAGRRVGHLTQSIDIGPTVMKAVGISPPNNAHGVDLLPLCRGAAAIREYVCSARQIGDRAEFAIQTMHEKLLVPQGDPNRRSMYFVKPDDRYDAADLLQANQERAEALEKVLFAYVAASQQPGPLDRPALPQPEISHADGETGRREHEPSQGASGL
jgi:membrane-anchored protein YejM (alkaline phosphatase superfamily)